MVMVSIADLQEHWPLMLTMDCVCVTLQFATCPVLIPWTYHRDTTAWPRPSIKPLDLGTMHNAEFYLGILTASLFRAMFPTSKVCESTADSRYAQIFKSG